MAWIENCQLEAVGQKICAICSDDWEIMFVCLYLCFIFTLMGGNVNWYTVKPVCNDHLYNKICYMWFIQNCVYIKTEGTNLLLLTIAAFWSHLDELQKAEKYPIGWSLLTGFTVWELLHSEHGELYFIHQWSCLDCSQGPLLLTNMG